jgi:hypothetical protein
MKYLKNFKESLQISLVEISEEDAYEYSKSIIDFPKTTLDNIESIEFTESIELIIHDEDMVLSDKTYKNQKVIKCKEINLIELNSGGLRGDRKWMISTFFTKEGTYICRVDEHEWKGSWRRKLNSESVFYKCGLDGLLEFVESSYDWF